MSDHEMCLLAAKAAGYTVADRGIWATIVINGVSDVWEPLVRSNQAFDLMVDCGISTEPRDYMQTVFADSGYGEKTYSEDYGTDKHAATRRVITRAAAAMGGEA